ncbi:MAG: T9SS type A sorting domain-containing protein, partial [Psychroflexus sp.]|nr:T9SS type A sorting domain-containing protein [Psychroflexus sp.]
DNSTGGELIIKETFTSNSGTLEANDKVVLKAFTTSDPDPDYNYPQMAVMPQSTGGTVEGLRVEKFFPARRAFRFVGSSVTTDTPSSTTIRENWQEDASGFDDDPSPGYGTHITGVAPDPNVDAVPADDGTNGFDYTPSGNASMFTYDSPSNAWNEMDNTDTNTLTAGDAYRLLVRGDRSIDITTASPSPTDTKLRSTGTAEIGDVALPVNNAGDAFNFIANPYHTPVDMNALINDAANSLQDVFYVWDPTLGGDPTSYDQQGGRGAYVAVTASNGTNNFSGTGTTDANQYLQPYQTVFVQNESGGGSTNITFKESFKETEEFTEVFSDNPAHFIRMNLYDANSYNNNDTPDDGLSIYFNANYSNTVESNDALKFFNIDENLASVNNGNYLCIEKRAMPQVGETIALLTHQYRDTDYIYEINVGSFPDNEVYLSDNYTDDLHELDENSLNTISFTVDPNVDASVAMDRFSIVFQETLGQEDFDKLNLQLYPNPTSNNQFNILSPELAGKTVNMTIADLNGRIIDQQEFSNFDRLQKVTPQTSLSTGVYLVKLESDGQQVDSKLIVE